MQIPGAELAKLHRAIELSFNPNTFDRLLLERWGKPLYSFIGLGVDFYTQVVAVVSDFNQHYTAEELLIALRDARPRNPVFVDLADLVQTVDLPAGLEGLLRAAPGGLPDAVDFRVRLAQCESQVCRVETATQLGTGILVGPNLVLTNYHVVPGIGEGGKMSIPANCLFDYRKGADGFTLPARRVAVAKAISWSIYSSEDLRAGQAAIDPNELDYALLELDEEVGNQGIVKSFDARGFASMLPNILLAQSAGIIILQHPMGEQLKIDIGAVTTLAGTRMRHSVNTLKGSSGAPLFDADLRLVGLHHAGFDWPATSLPYNQAIPLALIVADLQRKAIAFPVLP
jgi:hypothetical protein